MLTAQEIGVPLRFRRAALKDFAELAQLPGWNDHGLYIAGDAGVGKSRLAAALLLDAVRCGSCKDYFPGSGLVVLSHRWISAPTLLMELRGTMDSRGESERDVIGRYCSPRLLVLDDLGAERESDWTQQAIYMLLSSRVDAMRPTIVTSNLPLAEIDKRDPRLASRLGGMTYFKLNGVDRRLQETRQEG